MTSNLLKHTFDVLLATAAGGSLLVPMLAIAVIVRITSRGPVLYWSDRVGRDNRIFRMPKFRTMRIDAPEVAAHLLEPRGVANSDRRAASSHKSRRTSSALEHLARRHELRRSAAGIFNQYDLIAERTEHGVHLLTPGLTGWAQVNGRDELTVVDKTAFDAWYLRNLSLCLDLKILLLTVNKVVHRRESTNSSLGEDRRQAAARSRAA